MNREKELVHRIKLNRKGKVISSVVLTSLELWMVDDDTLIKITWEVIQLAGKYFLRVWRDGNSAVAKISLETAINIPCDPIPEVLVLIGLDGKKLSGPRC